MGRSQIESGQFYSEVHETARQTQSRAEKSFGVVLTVAGDFGKGAVVEVLRQRKESLNPTSSEDGKTDSDSVRSITTVNGSTVVGRATSFEDLEKFVASRGEQHPFHPRQEVDASVGSDTGKTTEVLSTNSSESRRGFNRVGSAVLARAYKEIAVLRITDTTRVIEAGRRQVKDGLLSRIPGDLQQKGIRKIQKIVFIGK